MVKNIVQDVVRKGGRRSIRDISLPGRYQNASHEKIVVHDETDYNKSKESDTDTEYLHREEDILTWEPRKKRNGNWIIYSLSALASLALIIAICNMFFGAKITLTPKSQIIQLNVNLTAKLKAPEGELSYKTLTYTKEKEMTFPADTERRIETRATGKIIIYNNFSSASQRLVKNTRFETPNGLIYKITDSVTIPGRTVVDGKTVMGSIEANVFAESVGAEYNIGLTDFTIPGFKSNQDRYKGFYARSKTPMTGGKVGMEKSLSDEKQKEAKMKIQTALTTELNTDAKKNVQPDFIFYEQAYRISFETVSVVPDASSNTVTIKERAKYSSYIINRDQLTHVIAKNYLDGYDNLPIKLVNADQLSFIFRNKEEFAVTSTNPIDFGLKGDAKIVWTIDVEKFTNALLGKKKVTLPEVASSESSVFKAEAVIRPFWKKAFPTNKNRIDITVIDPFAKVE